MKNPTRYRASLGTASVLATALVAAVAAGPIAADSTEPAPSWRLADRGAGVATSMFGTYLRGGELIVYPFAEFYVDDDYEYQPSELGFAGENDYRGRFRASEGLLFLAYGLGEDFAVEMEAAVIRASLEKAAEDPSALPAKLEESGLGDVEGQLRWRWRRETERRPELFSYFEVVFPHGEDRPLTGTPGLELKLGTGVTRGFRWGTLTGRAAAEYSEESGDVEPGEVAVEYLKRVSPAWRLYAGVEGTQDEVSFVGEAQWHLSPNAFVRLNTGVGLTSKATDWAPEIGVLFTLPRR